MTNTLEGISSRFDETEDQKSEDSWRGLWDIKCASRFGIAKKKISELEDMATENIKKKNRKKKKQKDWKEK